MKYYKNAFYICQFQLLAIERRGAEVIKVPYYDWWGVMVTRKYPGMKGHFVHPGLDRDVIAG